MKVVIANQSVDPLDVEFTPVTRLSFFLLTLRDAAGSFVWTTYFKEDAQCQTAELIQASVAQAKTLELVQVPSKCLHLYHCVSWASDSIAPVMGR